MRGALLAVGAAALSGNFETEQGGLRLSWHVQHAEATFVLQANASAYVAVGFGTGMAKTDMILCWVDDEPHAVDAWSVNHSKPLPDEHYGGTNDVEVLNGTLEQGVMSVAFRRRLNTSDSFDAVLPSADAFNVVFAWADGEPGAVAYHSKQHGHWMLDLSSQSGVPNSTFGAEMRGMGARYLVANMTVGALATLNIADGSGARDTAGFPHASVTSFADFGDGRPIVLLSELERNIINQAVDGRCSLEIHDQEKINQGMEAMMVPRTTLMGQLEEIKDIAEHATARDRYLAAHPDASMWIDFNDFHLYFLNLQDVYWVGGFGGQHYIGWISPSDYLETSPQRWGTDFVWQPSLPSESFEQLMV